MKRILAMLLALSCLLLAGCGQVWKDLTQISSDIGNLGSPTQPATQTPTQAPTEPPHTQTVPWMLIQNEEDLFSEEYAPSVRFRHDGTCDLKLNMAEFMLELTGRFTVKSFEGGSRVILCTYEQEQASGVARQENRFFLVEKEPGVWTFFGEGIGLTWTGGRFYPAGGETVTVDAEQQPVLSLEAGTYTETFTGRDTLQITQITGDALYFDASWYRLSAMTGAVAYRCGNYGFFEYFVEEDGVRQDWTVGCLEFTDSQTVSVTVFDSQLFGIDPGTALYRFDAQEEAE